MDANHVQWVRRKEGHKNSGILKLASMGKLSKVCISEDADFGCAQIMKTGGLNKKSITQGCSSPDGTALESNEWIEACLQI